MTESPNERSDRDWMRLHVDTLFTRDDAGDLIRVNEAGGAAAPRFLLGHTLEGNQCWFGPSLEQTLRDELLAHPAVTSVGSLAGPNKGEEELLEILNQGAPVEKWWAGPAYRFPESIPGTDSCTLVTERNADVLDPHFRDWLADVGECEPFAVALEDGKAAALCVSVRMTDVAHEAGVKTHPDFRGRGLASRVTAFWAAAVRSSGLVPLYSTSWSNEASRGVARSLGLITYGHTFHVT